MAFPNIQDFKDRLLDGGARPSLFEMYIDFPFALRAIAGQAIAPADGGESPFKFHCRIAEIPGNQHNPIIVKYAGREVKYAGQRTFNNLQLTILNDESFTVRRALEAWFEVMNTRLSNKSLLSAPTSVLGYAGTGTVNQYKKNGTIARSYRFVDMFPVTLAPIPLDWSNDGAIEDYTCEFAYQYWEPNGGSGRQAESTDFALDPR